MAPPLRDPVIFEPLWTTSTLACLLLGRDQHSAAVDDRGTGDSIKPMNPAHKNDDS